MSVQLKSTHQGNVNEILADFLLSLLGMANPPRRQFDHGFDFFCNISSQTGDLLTFDFPYTIQVKSGKKFKVQYGKDYEKWKQEDVSWLYSHETPFFIGFLDVEAKTLNIYDTTGLWYLYGQTNFNCSQIVFKPSIRKQGERRKLPIRKPISKWGNDKGDGFRWEIDLGNPIISITPNEVNCPESLETKRSILRSIILVERQNIINRNLGVYCFDEIKINTTNEPTNIETRLQILNNYEEKYILRIYNSIKFALLSLSVNLRYHKREEEYKAIEKVLDFIPKNEFYYATREDKILL